MRKYILTVIGLLLLWTNTKVLAQDKLTALVGATVIDVTNYGNGSADIKDAVVLIQHGKILKCGVRELVHIPAKALVINVKGKYIVPGLIDCFSVIGTQGQANSHLYYGVTTIVAGPGDDRRKGFMDNADPSPHIKKLTAIPFEDPGNDLEDTLEKRTVLSAADIHMVDLEIDKIDSLKKAGFSTILLQHMFPVELLPKMVAQCRKYGINTIGEIQYAPYSAGIKAGVNSFVHTSRYILGAFPDSVFIPLVRNPFDSLSGKRYIKYLYKFNIATDVNFHNYAEALASSHTALMPTLSMLYTSLPDHKNIWKEPGAFLTNPADVFLPMDTATGKSNSFMSSRSALRQIEFEKEFIKQGVHYITGSGADAFGSLPGISEHIEIQMLHRYGLTNRQALAAATNNPSVFNNWTNIGRIEAGRNADILVLSADPLADLENLKKIDMLWLNGKQIDRNALLKKK